MPNLIFKFLLIFLSLNISAFARDLEFLETFEEEYNTTEVSDPLRNYNTMMHSINWGLYDYLLKPAAEVYREAIPLGYRLGIYNFFENLTFPVRFLSHLFALQPKEAMNELGRFVLNSSVGIFGIFDVASQNQLYSKKIDFGITFGIWGFESGAYLVLPLLGPSNIRDTAALPLSILAYPVTYIDSFMAGLALGALETISSAEKEMETLDSVRKGALGGDDYIFVRDAYEQRRNALIKGEL